MNEERLISFFEYRKQIIINILEEADENTPDWINGIILKAEQQRQILNELINLRNLLLEEL